MPEPRRIGIEDLGIGTVLKRYTLIVPSNQREYSWTEKEVGDRFDENMSRVSFHVASFIRLLP